MQDSWFKDWFNSKYYHQLYQNRDENEASKFIDKLIDSLAPPKDALMLDLACGKGRHSLQLANKGFDVTGIDLSEMSIQEALAHELPNLHFYKHDMRQTFWINYFDYVFNFFTSFGYFNTARENSNAMQTMSQSLKKKGTLVIDYLNSGFAEDNMVHQEEKVIDQVEYKITKWYDDHKFYKKILIQDEELTSPIHFTEVVSRFSLQDFKEIMNPFGLKIKEVYGDYKLSNYDERKSPRLIIIAEKIN